jgi:hypothetical protein
MVVVVPVWCAAAVKLMLPSRSHCDVRTDAVVQLNGIISSLHDMQYAFKELKGQAMHLRLHASMHCKTQTPRLDLTARVWSHTGKSDFSDLNKTFALVITTHTLFLEHSSFVASGICATRIDAGYVMVGLSSHEFTRSRNIIIHETLLHHVASRHTAADYLAVCSGCPGQLSL